MVRMIEYMKKGIKAVTTNEEVKRNLKICARSFVASYLVAFVYYMLLLAFARKEINK